MSDSDNSKNSEPADNDPAVSMIRQKVDSIYNREPDAREEAKEVTRADKPLSKHQAYMKKISSSGMSLAEIQTAWHNYYVALSDKDKHEVWQEFYAEHDKQDSKGKADESESKTPETKPAESKLQPQPIAGLHLPPTDKPAVHHVAARPRQTPHTPAGSRTVHEVKKQLTNKATLSAQSKLKAKQHFQSLLFGVGMGLIVVIILLFGFFNDRFIAPFITPSKNVSNTPIIIDGATAVGAEPKIVIPKINVEIPVVYDEPSVEEHAIQNALERGVVHYATTPNPGQIGNAVIFGHSSNNILNKGKYKFAFVLLNKLEIDDTFYINKDGTRYAYKIYQKKVVSPTELSVLNGNDKTATVTLITCDPPGTTLNRLIVVGEQISPDPGKNLASTAVPPDTQETVLASNAPSLWQRIRDWF